MNRIFLPAMAIAIISVIFVFAAHAEVTGSTSIPAYVARPEIGINVSPTGWCGIDAGNFNLTIKTDITWPVIGVRSEVPAAFSVPYVPKNAITPGMLGPGCDFEDLGWWDTISRSMVHVSGNAIKDTTLDTGRGYVIKSRNDCNLSFEIFRYFKKCELNEECRIQLMDFTDAPSLIGSVANILDVQEINSLLPAGDCKLSYGSDFSTSQQIGASVLIEADGSNFPVLENGKWKITGRKSSQIEPGKAYWMFSNAYCYFSEYNMNDRRQPNRRPFYTFFIFDEPKYYQMSYSIFSESSALVYDWKHILTKFPDLPEEEYNDNNIYDPVLQDLGIEDQAFFLVTPHGNSGTYRIRINATMPEWLSQSSKDILFYYKETIPPEITATEISSENRLGGVQYDYSVTVTNKDVGCQNNKSFYYILEAAPDWDVSRTGLGISKTSSSIGPNGNDNLLLSFLQKNSGGCANLIAMDTNPARISYNSFYGNIGAFSMSGSSLVAGSGNSIDIYDISRITETPVTIIAGGDVLGVTQNSNDVFWIEKDTDPYGSTVRRIMSADRATTTVSSQSIEDNVNGYFVAADDDYVYWTESDKIYRKKIDRSRSKEAIAIGLNNAAGLAIDDTNIYWAEEDKIMKRNRFSDSVATVVQLNGINKGRHAIAVDNDFIYISNYNPGFNNLMRIRKDAVNDDGSGIVTMYGGMEDPAATFQFIPVGVSGDRLYWSELGTLKKISKYSSGANLSICKSMEGHFPPGVIINPKSGFPTQTVEFEAMITNANTNTIGDNFMYFYLHSLELPDGLKCLEGDFEGARPCFETDSDGTVHSNIADSPAKIYNGQTRGIKFYLRSEKNIPIGTVLEFNATITTSDSEMSKEAKSSYTVVTSLSPNMIIRGLDYNLKERDTNLAVQLPARMAWWKINLTNNDVKDTDFILSVVPDNSWGYWDALFYLYPYADSQMPGNKIPVVGKYYSSSTGREIKATEQFYLGIVSTNSSVPYPALYNFNVTACDSEFPNVCSKEKAVLELSPCIPYDICRPEDGETESNCPTDCKKSSINCMFTKSDGTKTWKECDNTTDRGVEFKARINTTVIPAPFDFYVCPKGMSITSCRTRYICYVRSSNDIASCSSANCLDEEKDYYIFAEKPQTSIRDSSSNYESQCPECLGGFKQTFDQWLINKRTEDEAAECCWDQANNRITWNTCSTLGDPRFACCPAPDALKKTAACRDLERQSVAAGDIFNQTIMQLYNNPSPAACNNTRDSIKGNISIIEGVLENSCGSCNAGGRFEITSALIENVSAGAAPEARIKIKNNCDANCMQNAVVLCNYRKGAMYASYLAGSDCINVPSGAEANISLVFGNATARGVWDANCSVYGSWLSNCGAKSEHDSIAVPFEVFPEDIPVYEVCSEACRNRGYDYGVCSDNCAVHSEGSVGCTGGASPRCCCSDLIFNSDVCPSGYPVDCTNYCCPAGATCDVSGKCRNADGTIIPDSAIKVTINDTRCDKISGNLFNLSYRAIWDEGDLAKVFIDNVFERNFTGPFEFSKMVTADATARRRDKQITTRIYNRGSLAYSDRRTVSCEPYPSVNLTNPRNGDVVRGNIRVEASASDVPFVDFMVDSVLLLTDRNSPYYYNFNTKNVADGAHRATVQGCNSKGCANDSASINVSNLIAPVVYTFSLQPESIPEIEAKAGDLVTISYSIENTGPKGRFTAVGDINTSWTKTTAVSGGLGRAAVLSSGESANISFNIRVPLSARNGEQARAEMTVVSQDNAFNITRRTIIIVSGTSRSAPVIENIMNIPNAPMKGDNMTVLTNITDPNGLDISVSVCGDRDCTKTYCTLKKNTSKSYACSFLVDLDPGVYFYYVLANNTAGKSITMSRSFRVSTRKEPDPWQQNLARVANASATASSWEEGFDPEKAIDGNAETYWRSKRGLPQWLNVDMGNAYNVSGFGIYSASNSKPLAFQILTSEDCVNYTKVYETNNAEYADDWYRGAFDMMVARCVMINVTDAEDNRAAIGEFEIYKVTNEDFNRARATYEERVKRNQEVCASQGKVYDPLANNGLGGCVLPESQPINIFMLIGIVVAIAVAIILLYFSGGLKKIARWWQYLRG